MAMNFSCWGGGKQNNYKLKISPQRRSGANWLVPTRSCASSCNAFSQTNLFFFNHQNTCTKRVMYCKVAFDWFIRSDTSERNAPLFLRFATIYRTIDSRRNHGEKCHGIWQLRWFHVIQPHNDVKNNWWRQFQGADFQVWETGWMFY